MSIRTYIFALLTSLVLLMAVVGSYLSASLFIGSFQRSTENMMIKIGHQYPENDKIEQNILGYHVTTAWEKVPQPVRDYFPVIPRKNGKLYSKYIDWIYIAPPNKIYSLLVVNHKGKPVFVSNYLDNVQEKVEQMHEQDSFKIDPIVRIILFGLSGIALFIVMLLSVFKKIAVPVESLQGWAKSLKISELNNALPNFRFKELNDLANLIHNNLASVAESIKREQDFLSYARHELRTPIAVIRSNSALLEKINPTPTEKERNVRDRINRASLTMKSMTETLLWLSREAEISMPMKQASLGDLVEHMHTELAYLLTGKEVSVTLNTDESTVPLAITPTLIVLNNLIRNAFQHTQEGFVTITQSNDSVTITNVEKTVETTVKVDDNTNTNTNTKASTEDNLGFGLGMQLVEKLTKQFHWHFSIQQENNSYQVTISFCTDDNLITPD